MPPSCEPYLIGGLPEDSWLFDLQGNQYHKTGGVCVRWRGPGRAVGPGPQDVLLYLQDPGIKESDLPEGDFFASVATSGGVHTYIRDPSLSMWLYCVKSESNQRAKTGYGCSEQVNIPPANVGGPCEDSWIKIPHVKYQSGIGQAPTAQPAVFKCSISDAENGNVDRPMDIAFEKISVSKKASIRFEFIFPQGFGDLEDYKQWKWRQVNMTVRGQLINRGQLASVVAKALKGCMDDMERRKLPFTINGKKIEYDQIYLLKVKWSSKGSIQPILGVPKPQA